MVEDVDSPGKSGLSMASGNHSLILSKKNSAIKLIQMNMTGGLKKATSIIQPMMTTNYANTRLNFNAIHTDVTRTTFTMKVREVAKMDYKLIKKQDGANGMSLDPNLYKCFSLDPQNLNRT